MTATLLFISCSFLLVSPLWGLGEILHFPTTPSVSNYVKLPNPDMTALETSFTICTWVLPRITGNECGVVFSYAATDAENNEISFADVLSGFTHIFGVKLASGPTLPRGIWSHVCYSWDFTSRKQLVYLNGDIVASGSTAAGRKVKAGGIIVLGQDQDSLGGNFAANQAFGGELYNMNIMNRRLTDSEISDLYEKGKCGSLGKEVRESVVIQWTDFLDAPRGGDVRVLRGVCSKWELVRGLLNEDVLDHLIQYHEWDEN